MSRLRVGFQVAQFEDKWRPFQLTKAVVEVGAMGLAGSFVVNSIPKNFRLLSGRTVNEVLKEFRGTLVLTGGVAPAA